MDNHKYIGDSFKVLPNLPDKRVDMILTDPPYDLTTHRIHWLHSEFRRLCKGAIVVFMPPENQWVHPADQYLFWIKPISTKNTSKSYSRFVEMIFVYNTGYTYSTWNCKRHWSQYTNVFTDLVDDASIHPYRKPPSLIERLIRNHTNEGDTILDPFAGSFVVSDVAERLGRNSISIEIEDKNANHS